jgi:hypothetical protein
VARAAENRGTQKAAEYHYEYLLVVAQKAG